MEADTNRESEVENIFKVATSISLKYVVRADELTHMHHALQDGEGLVLLR